MTTHNILMLTCQFMPDVFGGAEKQCLRQAKELVARGHNVRVYTTRASRNTPRHEVIDGVHVRRMWTICPPDLLGRWLPFSLLWLLQSMVYAWLRRQSYSLVHCHQGKYGLFVGCVMARIMRVPVLVKIGNSGKALDILALKRKKAVGPICLAFVMRCQPIFVAISGRIRQELLAEGVPEAHIRVITNGIEPLACQFVRGDDPCVHFFWHGRFEAIKNLKPMITAFAHAASMTDQPINLTLIGDGTLRGELADHIRSVKAGHLVSMLPPQEQIIDVIQRYDIFLNTSHHEGMSNSMLEAMKSGKYIVSTDVSGVDEIVDQGKNGYVIPSYSREDIAASIAHSANNFLAKAADIHDYNIRKTHQEFAMSSIISRYETLYQEMLSSQ